MAVKFTSNKLLPILAGVYALLYLALMIFMFGGRLFSLMPEDLLLISLFVLFLLGFALSWIRELASGLIFIAWSLGVGISNGFIERSDGGMIELMIVLVSIPIAVLGAFLVLQWYNQSKVSLPSRRQQWKLILQVLLLYYLITYVGFVFDIGFIFYDMTHTDPVNYINIPGIIYPILLGLFLAGFIFSWKLERLAGILLISWYGLALIGTISYVEVANSGPLYFGVPILLQGIFYLRISKM